MTGVINPVAGCHYFPPGLQLLSQPLTGLLPVLLLGEQRHNGCEQLPDSVATNDLNPGPSVPESSMLTTRLWRSCTCRHILQFRGVTLLCYDFCCTCNSNFCCGIYLNASVLAAFSQRKMHHVMSVDIQFTTPVQNLFNISACFPVKPAIHTDLLHLKTSVIAQRFSSINVIMNNVKKI